MNALDREQEKQDGKKNAIAETIAMMNKMKMEDNERKEAHKKIEDERRERNREMGIPEPLIPPEPVPEEEEYQHRGRRGRDQPRFQRGGPPRGRTPDRYRDDWDRRGPPPRRGRDDFRGPPRRGNFRDEGGWRGGPPRGPPRGYGGGFDDSYGGSYGQWPPRRENKKDKFPNYLDHLMPEDDPLATRTLFVGNLELNITDDEMKRIFGRYGELVDIDIKRPPPNTGNAFAFLRFANLDQSAMAKRELSGAVHREVPVQNRVRKGPCHY